MYFLRYDSQPIYWYGVPQGSMVCNVWCLAQLVKDGVVIDLPYVTGGDALQ